jgi:putative methyltransferase (TIGR04325 family)
MKAKDIVRLFAPPVLVNLVRRVRRGAANGHNTRVPEWEYIPEGWAHAASHSEVKGWNVEPILDLYKHKWPTFVGMTQGTGPLGLAHESNLTDREDINAHNTIVSFAYALALAAQQRGRLSMLDWGGGIGHYYLLAKALLPLTEIDYHCTDVPILAGYGSHLFPEQHFYSDDSYLNRTYDFVMASGSMHYVENWQALFTALAQATQNNGYLYITRLPCVATSASFVFIQRPYAYGYGTEYLAWCLNLKELLQLANDLGLKLVREFVIGERPFITDAPEQCQYRGFLFRSPNMPVNG